MIFKVFLFVVAYFIIADAQKLDRFVWKNHSDDTTKRSYQQVCEDIIVEEWVSTITLIKKDQRSYPYLFPQKIMKRRCKIEGKQSSGVNDFSVICKTKEKQIDVVEFNDQGIGIAVHNLKVPTDCVAYKI